MSSGSYNTDLEFRDHVHAEIRRAVTELKAGDAGVIAVSRTLSGFQHIIEGKWPELAAALMVFVGIDSETDALPVGRLREMWHLSTAHLEDQKTQQAEHRWRPYALEAGDRIARLLA